MKLSIVTISFNQEKYLRACIDSVLNQSFSNFEYIIVDPGSTDTSREIIESYEDARIIHVYDHDKGPADGLNAGFSRASGEVFGFLNSDDYLLPGALAEIMTAFEMRPRADVVCANGYLVDDMGSIVRKLFSSAFTVHRYCYGASSVVQQSTFFRRQIYEIVGGFNQDNRLFWDGELFARMAAHGAVFCRLSAFISAFRIHSASSTGGLGDHGKYLTAKQELCDELLGPRWYIAERFWRFFYRITKNLLYPFHAWEALKFRLGKSPMRDVFSRR